MRVHCAYLCALRIAPNIKKKIFSLFCCVLFSFCLTHYFRDITEVRDLLEEQVADLKEDLNSMRLKVHTRVYVGGKF